MHLSHVEIRNFRSLYDDGEGERAFELDLCDGLNLLVGRNNCGKSNVLRAVALALDPHFPFDKATDQPAQKLWAWPTVTLGFKVPGSTGARKDASQVRIAVRAQLEDKHANEHLRR